MVSVLFFTRIVLALKHMEKLSWPTKKKKHMELIRLALIIRKSSLINNGKKKMQDTLLLKAQQHFYLLLASTTNYFATPQWLQVSKWIHWVALKHSLKSGSPCTYYVVIIVIKILRSNPEPAPKPNLNPCSYLILPSTSLGKYTASTHTVK